MVAKEYSSKECMAYVCAREILDGWVLFVGVGIPMMAALVASKTHAKNTVLVYEGGAVGGVSRRLPYTIVDNACSDNALLLPEMWRLFSDMQCGFVDMGIIGGAQIDKFGNLNSTVITNGGQKSYAAPAVRLPGSGGANDIATSTNGTLIVMAIGKGKFVNTIDFVTSPGYLTGPGAREKAGIRWGGPRAVVTDKCVFRFDDVTKEMYLDSVYPGVTVEEIKDLVEWDLKVATSVRTLDPPEEEYVQIMRAIDPAGVILGKKTVENVEEFEDFYNSMVAAYESVQLKL